MTAPLFLFAPGAGAASSSVWMRRYAEHLLSLGKVQTLDYPYMLAGQKRPDPLPRLIAAHVEALERAALDHDGPIVLIGKSMGGRVGCHVALMRSVSAVVCLGYPLVSPGARKALRDQVLLDLSTPALFVQGTRDPLCPLDILERVRPNMSARNELYVVAEGDHSLEVTQRWLRDNAQTQAGVEASIIQRIAQFVSSVVQPEPP